MTHRYSNPVCRGSVMLGNNCGHCERCAAEKAAIDAIAADVTRDPGKVISSGELSYKMKELQAIKAETSDAHQAPMNAAQGAPEGALTNGVAGLPVKGYRPTQEPWKVDLVNENKILEELVLRQIECHFSQPVDIDQRFVALARTKIQEAFMALNRAVFQPERLASLDGVNALVKKLGEQI